MKRNIIFFVGELDLRAGGPSGYLANLKKGIEETLCDSIKFIATQPQTKKLKRLLLVAKLLTFYIPVKSFRKEMRNKIMCVLGGDFWRINVNSPYYEGIANILDNYEFDSITCHNVRDVLYIRDYLKSRHKDSRLLLMSHCPEPPSEEIYATEKALNVFNAESNYLRWQRIEKEAFKDAADILLFPSKESVEPYSQALDYFDEIIENKEFKFLPTGCCQLQRNKDVKNLREKYNIKTPYVISYIGRHNKIKGYDLLQEIASRILTQRKDVTFLIGGKASIDIQPLNHDRWIELGFVNPSDVLSVSDCFILPNRQTYFDLVLLEVMSMGVPVFASATGGNKSVYQATNAINLYKSIDECVEEINSYLDSSIDVKMALKEKTLQAYKDNYTLEIFAKNYVKMIKDL